MLFLLISLLCGGIVQCTKIEEIESKPSFNFSSTPAKNIFLKAIHPIPEYQRGRTSLKIVNGQAATRGQFCHQVYLQFTDGRNYWSCGGSLVTLKLILTAAHCVLRAVKAIAVLGALDLSISEPGRLIISVSSIGLRFHKDYDPKLIHNDIGVVELPYAVELNKYICTVGLPSCNKTLTEDSGNYYNISGWGKTSDRTRTSKLMYVTVPGESQSSCTDFYKKVANYDIIQSQMCTSGAAKKSTCNGDSGGPLVQQDKATNIIQLGIVSLGLNTCEYGAPSVYTDLRFFLNWLCPQL